MVKKSGKDFTYVSSKKYDGMMGRCYRTKDPSYKHFGGRGIRVHGEWIKDINLFRAWLLAELNKMGATVEDFVKFSAKYSLDRIDVNGHYIPSNLRLVSAQIQARNRRTSVSRVFVSAEGEKISY